MTHYHLEELEHIWIGIRQKFIENIVFPKLQFYLKMIIITMVGNLFLQNFKNSKRNDYQYCETLRKTYKFYVYIRFCMKSKYTLLCLLLLLTIFLYGCQQPSDANIEANDKPIPVADDNNILLRQYPSFLSAELIENQELGGIQLSDKEQSVNFILTPSQLLNIEKADLKFKPNCGAIENPGTLDVLVNGENIFPSVVPLCGDNYRQQIPLVFLHVGENKVTFKTNGESYSVEQILVDFEQEVKNYVSYFEVNKNIIEETKTSDKDIVLTIEFSDDIEPKSAELDINNELFSIDQSGKIFTKDLKGIVKEGNNVITIKPKTNLDIIELKVALE